MFIEPFPLVRAFALRAPALAPVSGYARTCIKVHAPSRSRILKGVFVDCSTSNKGGSHCDAYCRDFRINSVCRGSLTQRLDPLCVSVLSRFSLFVYPWESFALTLHVVLALIDCDIHEERSPTWATSKSHAPDGRRPTNPLLFCE